MTVTVLRYFAVWMENIWDNTILSTWLKKDQQAQSKEINIKHPVYIIMNKQI